VKCPFRALPRPPKSASQPPATPIWNLNV
jgi:hypothetical protein